MKKNWKTKLPRAITSDQLRAVHDPKEKLFLISPYDLAAEREKCRRLGLATKNAFVWRKGMDIAFCTLPKFPLNEKYFQPDVASDGTVMRSSNLGTKLGEMICEASDLYGRALKQYRSWCRKSQLIRRFDPEDKMRTKYGEFCRSVFGPYPQARFLNFALQSTCRIVAVCLVVDESRVWSEKEVRDSITTGFRYLKEPGRSYTWAPDMQFTDLAVYRKHWRSEGLNDVLPNPSVVEESEKWWGSAAYQLIDVGQAYCRACDVVPGFKVAWNNLGASDSSLNAALQIAIPLAYCKCVLVGLLEALAENKSPETIRFTKCLDVAMEAGRMLSRAQFLIDDQATTRFKAEQGKGKSQSWFWHWVFSGTVPTKGKTAKEIFYSLGEIRCEHLQNQKFTIVGDTLFNPDGTKKMKCSGFVAQYSKNKALLQKPGST